MLVICGSDEGFKASTYLGDELNAEGDPIYFNNSKEVVPEILVDSPLSSSWLKNLTYTLGSPLLSSLANNQKVLPEKGTSALLAM
jgi:hypothetical protein